MESVDFLRLDLNGDPHKDMARLSAPSGITEKHVIWKLWSYLVEDDASHQIESE